MGFIVSCSDWSDVATAECEIAALRFAPTDTRFISISVEPFSSLNCAFHVRLLAESLPDNSVIMASADPRTPGIPREPLVIGFVESNLHLVCPNNGIATLLLEKLTPRAAVLLAFDNWDESLWNGRDLYAPVAGRISAGVDPISLGESFPVDSIHKLNIAHGTVLHIDNYGNVKIFAYDDLTGKCQVKVNGRSIRVASNFRLDTGQTVPEGELIATHGTSFGLVQLMVKSDGNSVVGASDLLGVKVGEVVDFSTG